jgi:hypothetical protein
VMPSRSAKACSDSARLKHACPPASALISAGSRRALWFGLIQSWHQLGFDTAPLEGDCCSQLNSTTSMSHISPEAKMRHAAQAG